jgi:uncharacterized RDD family membrane protein YckC
MMARSQGVSRQGNYAGAISRLVALAADVVIAWWALLAILAGVNVAITLVLGHGLKWSSYRIPAVVTVAVWYPLYFAYQWALSGKTLAMALFGVRVVTAEGRPITARQAIARIIVLPFSIALFGLGIIGVVLRTDHRGWHDRAARTCVVYDWDAKAARLRWLARKNDVGTVETPAPAS